MADTAEDFAAKLMVPIAAIAAVIFFVQKVLEWIWRSIVPYAIPILYGLGALAVLGIICFILFMRVGRNCAAWKSFAFCLLCSGAFGVVVLCGNNDKLPWAQQIIDSMSWITTHPLLVSVSIIMTLIIAVTIPIPGLGSSRNRVRNEFMRGFEDGMKDKSQGDT